MQSLSVKRKGETETSYRSHHKSDIRLQKTDSDCIILEMLYDTCLGLSSLLESTTETVKSLKKHANVHFSFPGDLGHTIKKEIHCQGVLHVQAPHYIHVHHYHTVCKYHRDKNKLKSCISLLV